MSGWTAKKAAARGANWLDKKVPGWFRSVKIRDLSLESDTACVLGQLTGALDESAPGRWTRVVDVHLGIERPRQHFVDGCSVNLRPLAQSRRQSDRRGFSVPFDLSHSEWDHLNEARKSEIRRRRGRSGTNTRPSK